MSIKKQYLKTDGSCKVTFKMASPEDNIQSVKVLGDFNGWDQGAASMKKLKNGDFSLVQKLEPGREYQFRYFVNDSYWENEPEADKHVHNNIHEGEYNSVILL